MPLGEEQTVPALESLVDRIYEAAALPDRWPEVLDALAGMANAVGGVLLVRCGDQWTGWRVSKPLEKAFLAYLQTDIPQRSQTTARLIATDWAGFVANTDVFTPEEWEDEPLRAEWGRKWGLDHGTATAIQVPSGEFLVFHIQRPEGAPSFNRRDHRPAELLPSPSGACRSAGRAPAVRTAASGG
jgi:hypothetical protein